MKRVCIFCEEWGTGGIETFLLNVLSHVDRREFSIEIATALLKSEAYDTRLVELGLELHVLPGNTNRSHMRFRAFSRWVRGQSFDVAYFNLYQGLALGYVRAARKAGIPVRVVHSHNTDLRKSALRPVKLAIHGICKRLFSGEATCRLACSEAAARFLFPASVISDGQWHILPNGIQLERFRFDERRRAETREALKVGEGPVVGCIGRLCYQKNQSFLLQVFEKVIRTRPDAFLILIGEGEDLPMLKQQARVLGLQDRVVFFGVTNRVPELLWAFDVLAMPSVFEGLGIVAIEAQAAGLPVVCSDRVPPEVHLTELVEALPLGSVERWAETLLARVGVRNNDTLPALHSSGYAIEEVADRLQHTWSDGN